MMFSSAKVDVLLKWSWTVAFGKDVVSVPRQKCLGKMKLLSPELGVGYHC